jgi:hypothetical protein
MFSWAMHALTEPLTFSLPRRLDIRGKKSAQITPDYVSCMRSFPAGLAPRRIVSLVPSWTEALFAIGLGPQVVGVTDWCYHPANGVADLPKIGGETCGFTLVHLFMPA